MKKQQKYVNGVILKGSELKLWKNAYNNPSQYDNTSITDPIYLGIIHEARKERNEDDVNKTTKFK